MAQKQLQYQSRLYHRQHVTRAKQKALAVQLAAKKNSK